MASSRTRVLFIGEAATLAHVARPATLAAALPPAEFDVTLACDSHYGALFQNLPFPVRAVWSQPAGKLLRNARRGWPLFDLETLARYVQDDLSLFAELSPAIVVGDMRLSLCVSATLGRIPYVNVISAQWSPYCNLAIESPDNPLKQFMPIPGAADFLLNLMRPLAMAMGAFPLNAVRVRYGLPPISHDLREVMSYADYAVYPDIPELVPTRALPREHRYLGPLLWSADTALPEWWDRVPEDKPVVYLNLGSSGAHDQLEMALQGLARLPVSVIAATAANGSVARFPDNAFLATYLPAEAATRRASLTINNGGAMSTQQSFHAGVPVLGLVTHADQLVFSKAVRQAGAGEFLTPSEATAPAVSALAKRMLETPSYGERARWLRARMEAYDPAARFLQLMREIVGRQAPRQ